MSKGGQEGVRTRPAQGGQDAVPDEALGGEAAPSERSPKPVRLPSRRQFLGGAVGVAALFLCGGAATAFAGDGTLLRPPGAQDEDRFLSLCLKCDRCRSVCPRGCIVTCDVEDGLANARTPKLDFKRGYCDFCGKCAEVCPTGAVAEGVQVSQGAIGVASIDQDLCLAYNGGGCQKCVDVCPYGAVGLDGPLPHVDPAACTGCGLCVLDCPSESLRAFTGSRDRRGINVDPDRR